MTRVKVVIVTFYILSALVLIGGIAMYSQLRDSVSPAERLQLSALGLSSPSDTSADTILITSIAFSISFLLFNRVITAIGQTLDNTDEIITELRRQKLYNPTTSQAPLQQNTTYTPPAPAAISYGNTGAWTCRNCGQTNKQTATFCKGCGEYK